MHGHNCFTRSTCTRATAWNLRGFTERRLLQPSRRSRRFPGLTRRGTFLLRSARLQRWRPLCPGAEVDDVECLYRPRKALQRQLSDCLAFDCLLDRYVDACADQDLASRRLVGQASREVGDASDRCIVEKPLGPDRAEGRVAEGDSDPDV